LAAAQRRGFRHVRAFGSVRRSEATGTSDVDLLVDRDPGTSLLDRAALGLELERLLHRKVDVVPEESLHWLIRPQVMFEALPL
jgi:predicted nucleotidyltransferase